MNTEKLETQFNKLKGDWDNVNRSKTFSNDDRHTYGAGCSWNGPIAQVGSNGGLPSCPHCNGMLFEMPASEWNTGIEKYSTEKNDRDYAGFMSWLSTRGTCSPLRGNKDLANLRSEFINLHLI